MLPRVTLALIVAMVGRTPTFAQADLYDPGSVRELRIHFHELDWRSKLDSLYLLGEDERLIGDLEIDGTYLPDVGVRFKGYSSYSPGRVKNPFNIKLDEVHDGQDYQGYDKLKLSNVIQDPSFLREVLAYEIARNYMPASRANHADLYVNDTLIGLYVNVEDVGRDFLEEHFGSRDNAFFKGNPPTVDLTGDNCNLSDSPGTDSTDYYDLYDIQSDQGWGQLLDLIEVLNDHPDTIERVLNVDRALWMHAFNYALINFDSYVGYAQNYYLYQDDDGLWNPIIWDLNMSFASFRLTDASTYWNGFTIPQAIAMDPLGHFNGISVFPRPLMRNLFGNAMYRRMYLAHLRTIIQENFADQSYRERALGIRQIIGPHVQADTNKFYDHQAFLDNLDDPVSFTVDYPGLTQLMDARTLFLSTYPGMTGEPAIGAPAHVPEDITLGGTLTITVPISGADTAFLAYRHGDRGAFRYLPLMDDGAHGDGPAGDGVYGAQFISEANLLEYYLYAENNSAGTFSPDRAAYETHRIQTRLAPGALVINEFMAFNTGAVDDPSGGTADWIELYNPNAFAVSTAGLHLSDDPDQPTKWPLPVASIGPNGYFIVWADGRTEEGDDHANFKLEASGESLLLAYDGTAIMDRSTFGPQYPIYSTGRYPNGSGDHRLMPPTFRDRNDIPPGYGPDRPFQIYPNPATTEVCAIVQLDAPFDVQIMRSDGKVMTALLSYGAGELVRIDTRTFPSGHYVMQVRTASSVSNQPFIVLP